MAQQEALFDERFIDRYGGTIVKDPVTAIVELVANAWDSGASKVVIKWPKGEGGNISISDNGEGMAEEEFTRRWYTLYYDRLKEQGGFVSQVADRTKKRRVYGKNGVGRFAPFCFSSSYTVVTRKNGWQVTYTVSKGAVANPIRLDKVEESKCTNNGTTVSVLAPSLHLSASDIRAEMAMRFLSDPAFEVIFNEDKLDFQHIPADSFDILTLTIDGVGQVTIHMIDTQKADKTMKQHGIAWWVNGRIVGECSWDGHNFDAFLDGRTAEAKRYTFIVIADCLSDFDCINDSWTQFKNNDAFTRVKKVVDEAITHKLLESTKAKRGERAQSIRQRHGQELSKMGIVSKEKWNDFLTQLLEQCPSIGEKELESIMAILANLEVAKSRYGLLEKLHLLNSGQLDELHCILTDWSIDTAKAVLDELRIRIKLVDEIRIKTSSDETLEVQDLQPLFEKGLWIFGPEYETIEYTSNEGMTTVLKRLFKSTETGSLNRPDFAILPDASLGLYSYPAFSDEDGAEIGIARLVMVDLKKPDVVVGQKHKGDSWKWVKELHDKGVLGKSVPVRCFILGKQIDPLEIDSVKHGEFVHIIPLTYNTILTRAKSRLLKLYDKVKSAPFLQDTSENSHISDNNKTLFVDADQI